MKKFILPIFWSLLGVFLLQLIVIQPLMGSPLRDYINNTMGVNFVPMLFLFFQTIFFLLGLALLILVIKTKMDRTPKKFMLVTGASATGISMSILLHNLAYGLFIQFFGEDFWQRTGLEDEPFFFLMAIIICPIAYFVGTIGSIVIIFQRRSF